MTTTAPPKASTMRAAPASAPRGTSHPIPPAANPNPLFAAPTLFGALAVIGGATALNPLIAGLSWLLPIVEVVAVIWLVGIGARLLGATGLVVSLLQTVAFALSVTGLQLHTGIGGFIPGSAALDETTVTLRAAWEQIMTSIPPTPATAEIGLFVTLALGAVAVVVDQLIAGARAPALVGLPLLGLYSVPTAIAADLLPWHAFVFPAVCYVAVLATAAPPHGAIRTRTTVSLVVTSAVIAVGAIGASVAVTAAADGIGTEGRLPHTGRTGGQIGLSPWALLRGELTDTTEVDVAKVSGLSAPQYLRTFALEKWEPGIGFALGAVRDTTRDINGTLPDAASTDGDTETVTVSPQNYRDKYLPIYLDATAVSGLNAGWNYDAALRTVFRTEPTTPPSYHVTTRTDPVTESELRGDTIAASPGLMSTGDLPQEVTSLAQQLTANATNAFDAVDALLHFFTDPANGFTYSLTTAPGNSGNALVDFLSTRAGYCEQYAAAMAIMARSVGIPARVGIGFTQGEQQSDGSYQVTSRDAHAWVEVPFEGVGWVIFDPTPSVDGQGGLQGFSNDGAAASNTATPSTAPTGATTSGSTSATGSATQQGAPAVTTTVTTAPAAGGGSDVGSGVAGRIGMIVLIVAALLILAATPSWVRRRRRGRRLAASSTGSARAAEAAWREIVDSAIDHGVEVAPGQSVRVTANNVATTARLSAGGRSELRSVVVAVERNWYGADSAVDLPDLAPAVRAIVIALRHERPQSRRQRWWPLSLRRSSQ